VKPKRPPSGKARKPKRKPIMRHSREGMKVRPKRAARKRAP
jgi:hypothetical protein